jgi:hypothetical protein
MDATNLRGQLRSRMTGSFMSVNENKNVVLLELGAFSKEQLMYVLTQYFQFPRNIVSILVSAAYTFDYHGWIEFVAELRGNVFEELGGGGGRIASEFGPHYSIVRKELESIFDVDIDESKPSVGTMRFLESISHIVQSEPWRAAGGVFAMEASAVPELGIVRKLAAHLAELHGKSLTERLVNFFQFHVSVIETGHRDRLISLVENQLSNPSNFEKFIQGYDSLLGAMDNWWSELNLEAKVNHNEPVLTNA